MSTRRSEWADQILKSGGDGEAASYVDDTSVDRRETAGLGVWIMAQVLRDLPPTWYYELLTHAPNTTPELKAADLLKVYSDLPRSSRKVVDAGLRSVRIYVTDKRTYVSDFRQIWEAHGGMPLARLTLADMGDGTTRLLIKLGLAIERAIAQAIVSDSVQHRMARWLRSLPPVAPGGVGGGDRVGSVNPASFNPRADLEMLARTGKGASERAAEYVSKSAPVFSFALEQAEAVPPDYEVPRYGVRSVPGTLLRATRDALAETHVYDRGDESMIELLEAQRGVMLEEFQESEPLLVPKRAKPIGTEDSMRSWRVQAADVAAGFAKVWYMRGGPMALSRRFDAVLLNGRRLTERDAAEVVRRHGPSLRGSLPPLLS